MKNYVLLLLSLALMGCESDFDKCLSAEIVNSQDLARLQTIKAVSEITAITEEIAKVEEALQIFKEYMVQLAENEVAFAVFRKRVKNPAIESLPPIDPMCGNGFCFLKYLDEKDDRLSFMTKVESCQKAQAEKKSACDAASDARQEAYDALQQKLSESFSLPHPDLPISQGSTFHFWTSFSATLYPAWLEKIGLCDDLADNSVFGGCLGSGHLRYALLEANDLVGFQNLEKGYRQDGPWPLDDPKEERVENWIEYGGHLTKGANEYLEYLKKRMVALNPNPKDLATKICNARGLYD